MDFSMTNQFRNQRRKIMFALILKLWANPKVNSYARNLAGQVIVLAVAIGGLQAPIFYTSSQWAMIANGIWGAFIPTYLKKAHRKK
jgi:hypothetical protein